MSDCFYSSAEHLDLHGLTHSFPTRRSSDLASPRAGSMSRLKALPVLPASGGLTTPSRKYRELFPPRSTLRRSGRVSSCWAAPRSRAPCWAQSRRRVTPHRSRTEPLPQHRTRRKRPTRSAGFDRKSVVEGKSVSVRVDLGGRRYIKKKK